MSDFKHEADVDYKYFLNDKDGEGLIFFKCIKERHNYARRLIMSCLDDTGWDELKVNSIVTGEVSHTITQYNTTERPDDCDIDEDGCDSEGTYWGDWQYRCNYKLTPVELQDDNEEHF